MSCPSLSSALFASPSSGGGSGTDSTTHRHRHHTAQQRPSRAESRELRAESRKLSEQSGPGEQDAEQQRELSLLRAAIRAKVSPSIRLPVCLSVCPSVCAPVRSQSHALPCRRWLCIIVRVLHDIMDLARPSERTVRCRCCCLRRRCRRADQPAQRYSGRHFHSARAESRLSAAQVIRFLFLPISIR